MALITAEARENLIGLFVGMFDAVPGADNLSLMVTAWEDGATYADIAASLALREEFLDVYPPFLTGQEFVERLADNLLTDDVPDSARDWAMDWALGRLNAGVSRADVILAAVTNLAATTNPNYADAQAQFENKIEVATYYSVEKELSSDDLEELQEVLEGVTSDDDSVDDAKDVVDGIDDDTSGETFLLTTGADVTVGTNGSDTFNALSINAVGTAATTFSAFDDVDGDDGTDTLNVYTDTTAVPPLNAAFPASTVVKNVEIVNIFNQTGAAALGDASKFQGVEELWQHSFAAAVTNLAATTTAGFKNLAAGAAMSVTAAAGAASASVALAGIEETSTLAVIGANAVNVSGAVVDGVDPGPTVGSLATAITVGLNAAALTVNTGVAATLTIADNAASTTNLATVDASGSTGAVTYAGAVTESGPDPDYAARTIKTGTGNDVVTIATVTVADNPGTTADETVSGWVETGAGNDTVTVNSSGTGLTTVVTGAGNDTVSVTARSTKLTVDMGDGNDSFTSAVAVTAVDSVDAGAGTDTLRLSLVGAANVAAFKNFDVYDVVGMAANLDLDILNTNNTVAEIVGSGAITAPVTLLNVAAGVNFRATGSMGVANTLSLTQKTAGALTATLDADQTVNAAGDDAVSMDVAATNATSVAAVFDASYVAAPGAVIANEVAATDNISTIELNTTAATSVSVVSGGTNSQNVFALTDSSALGKVASVAISGAQHLTLTTTTTLALNNIDSSAATGGLTASLASVKNGGNITLGSGTDAVTVTNASTTGAVETITAFEKTAAVSVSVLPADAAAMAAAIAGADKLVLAGATVADSAGGVFTGGTIANGKLTFIGAGPATLADAIGVADVAAETAGEAVVFEYIGNSYVFVQGGTDTVAQLVGITGVTNFVETGVDQFFIV